MRQDSADMGTGVASFTMVPRERKKIAVKEENTRENRPELMHHRRAQMVTTNQS
jgi:hypothetical protein